MVERFVNPRQPDLLQYATWIAYVRALFLLVYGLDDQFVVLPLSNVTLRGVSNPLVLVLLFAALAGGTFLMNQGRRLGHRIVLGAALAPLACRVLLALGIFLNGNGEIGRISPLSYDPLGLAFEVALVVLLLHPRSRDYEKRWLS